MAYQVISFYRYTEIKNPEVLRDLLRNKCEELNLLGRILLGEEGINGAVSGELKEIKQIKLFLRELYPGLTFREQNYLKNAYHKLVVRTREEICRFGKEVDLNNKGKHLQPEELKKWYDQEEDFVIIDARNDYEYEVGRFKGSLNPEIKNFRDFPKATEKYADYKDKKIVLYCTGGVRCEKASAYMKEQGFQEVYQLDGGIINFVNKFPDTYWEGGLFVFDDRLVSDVGEAITNCEHCETPALKYYNCHNLDCDKLFICCDSCKVEMARTCSETCKLADRKRKVLQI